MENDQNTSNSGFSQNNGFDHTGGYGQNNGFDQTIGYGQQNGYNQTNGYGQSSGYHQTNGYGQSSGYNQANGYGQSSGYNQANGYGQGSGYHQTNGYGQGSGYHQGSGFQQQTYGGNPSYFNHPNQVNHPNNFANGQYGNDPGIPNVTPFQEPPKKEKKGIAIVIILVALLAVAAVIFAFVMGSKKDEKEPEKKAVVETKSKESETETNITEPETEIAEETKTKESVAANEDFITPYDYYMENDSISVDSFIESCYGGDWDAFKAACVEYDPQTLINKGYNYTGNPVKFTGVVSYTDSKEGVYYISKTGIEFDEILFFDDSKELDPVYRGEYVTFYGMYITNIDGTDETQIPGCYLIAIDELNYSKDQELVALTYTYTEEESKYAKDMSDNITYSIFEDEDYASLDFFFTTEKYGNFCILVQTRFYDKDKNLIFVSYDTADFFSDQKNCVALLDMPHRRGDYYDLIKYDSYEYDMYIYEIPAYGERSIEEITYEITDKGGTFELKLTNNTEEERAISVCVVTYDEEGKIVETYVEHVEYFTGTTTKTIKMYETDYVGYEVIYYYIY